MLIAPVTVINKLGLHARACGKLVTLLQQHPGVSVYLARAGQAEQWVDARNLMLLLMMGAGIGTQLQLKVVSPDNNSANEQTALAAVIALFNDYFGEGG